MAENTLLDRYVHEMGQHLPRKLRADIQLELRSSLQDMFEEKGLDSKNEEDSEAISQLLINFGQPEKVAASYLPKRSLVGPNLFPAFILAVKIAGAVLLALFSLGLSFDIANDGFSWNALIHPLTQLANSLFQILGVIVFVFILLERFGAEEETKEQDWDPRKLPKVDDPNRISRTELIVSLIFSSVALVIFNFFPQIIAIYGSINGEWGVLARLAPEFSAHIPWLSVLWALEIVMWIEILRKGKWTLGTRLSEFALSLFGLFVLYRIVMGGPILTLTILSWLVKGALSIAFIVSIFDTLSQAYHLVIRPSNTSIETVKVN